MTSLELRKINSYNEWKTAEGIQRVKDFLNGVVLDDNQMQMKLERNFGNGNWIVDENDLLHYRPLMNNNEFRIDLVVIDPNLHQDVLQEIYDRKGNGNGINKFYSIVTSQVLGITRNETTEFLKRQGNYQITRPYQKIINNPILAKTPNERWSADVFFVNKYGISNDGNLTNRNTYLGEANIYNNVLTNRNPYLSILVVVDYFSKKVWAKPLKNNTSIVTRDALNEIIEETNTTPHILQLDNGRDFLGEFKRYCENHQPPIKIVTTTSYTPMSNGLVEVFNKIVRKHIKEGLVKRNTLEWVTHLPSYLENMNSTKSSVTGFTPNELWTEGYRPLRRRAVDFNITPNDNSSPADIIRYVEAKLYKNAMKKLDNSRKPNIFARGDIVRLKISALKNAYGAEYRKRIKEKLEAKYNSITYTPQKFKIISIYRPPARPNFNINQPQNINFLVRNQQYSIGIANNNPNNIPITAGQNNTPFKFYGSDLMLVPPDSTRITINPRTLQRSRYINRYVDLTEDENA
jgi:hypothetical protein